MLLQNFVNIYFLHR